MSWIKREKRTPKPIWNAIRQVNKGFFKYNVKLNLDKLRNTLRTTLIDIWEYVIPIWKISGLFKSIKSKKELENFIQERSAHVTQTTLSVDDTKEIISILKEKFSNIREPAKEDICYATTNRQMAVKNIAKKCDLFFVIGSRNSSNSVRLVEVAKKSGCENSILIHSQSEIPFNLIENSNTIGISSGASAPEILVENFIKELKNKFTVTIEEVEIIKENVVFRVPKKLN